MKAARVGNNLKFAPMGYIPPGRGVKTAAAGGGEPDVQPRWGQSPP